MVRARTFELRRDRRTLAHRERRDHRAELAEIRRTQA
jgi:hypothetical protein